MSRTGCVVGKGGEEETEGREGVVAGRAGVVDCCPLLLTGQVVSCVQLSFSDD